MNDADDSEVVIGDPVDEQVRAVIPEAISLFSGAQLGMDMTGDALLAYAERRQTRQQHLEALREIYGCGPIW